MSVLTRVLLPGAKSPGGRPVQGCNQDAGRRLRHRMPIVERRVQQAGQRGNATRDARAIRPGEVHALVHPVPEEGRSRRKPCRLSTVVSSESARSACDCSAPTPISAKWNWRASVDW
jgi:hypothetical protein